jgi:hypothetical protein
MTFVWPSFWGWKAVDLVSLVSNSDQKLGHNVLRNIFSRYDMMVYGITKCTQTHLNKNLSVASNVIFFLQDVRMAILEN